MRDYEQTNIEVQVALRIGATAESSLLKADDGEVSFTVTGDQLNELPINFGIVAGAIRNPLSFAQMATGCVHQRSQWRLQDFLRRSGTSN